MHPVCSFDVVRATEVASCSRSADIILSVCLPIRRRFMYVMQRRMVASMRLSHDHHLSMSRRG